MLAIERGTRPESSRVLFGFVPRIEEKSKASLLTNWPSFVHSFGKELLRL